MAEDRVRYRKHRGKIVLRSPKNYFFVPLDPKLPDVVMPNDAQDMGVEADEDPFFVLLEDDAPTGATK